MRRWILLAAMAIVNPWTASFGTTAQELPRRVTLGVAVVDDSRGAAVTVVSPGTPAAIAGLHVGDIIVEIGETKVANSADFIRAAHAAHANVHLGINVLRANAPTHIELEPIFAPKESDPTVETEYSAIEVEGSLRRTLLTIPKGTNGKHPAVLLIGGIGCFSVDNVSDEHDSYRFLAHDLSKAGIVVLRVEKAGIGDSQGGKCFDTDFASESKSYEVALKALIRDSRVDSTQVFLFGHSIGTVIAPRLPLEGVSGIIVADGVGINWLEYELANLRRQSILNGDLPSETDAVLRSKEICMHRLLIERISEASIEADMPACKTRNAYPVAPAYMQQVAALNVAAPWMTIHVPILAIYGTADFVTDQSDQERIVDIVNSQHPGTATLRLIDGMDHHFELMQTPQKAYDVRVKEHGQGLYAKQLSVLVQDWICSHTRCDPSG